MANAIELRRGSAPLASSDEGITEWERMRAQAKTLVDSGFLAKAINTPEKALAIMQTGRELGLQPMQALRSIHIIEGKPTLSADLIGGLVLSRHPGATFRVAESSNDICVLHAARSGSEPTRFEFSIQDARNAGLTQKDVWRKYPRAMLRARCIAEAARAVFPDICAGLYDPDELDASTPPNPLPRIAPHMDDDGFRHNETGAFEELSARLGSIESALPSAKSYDDALMLRELLGSKAKQSQLTKEIQAAGERNELSAEQRKELGKTWQRINRQVEKIEKAYPPPNLLESFRDEPDTDAPQPGDMEHYPT